MILHPAVMALLFPAVVTCLLLLHASRIGLEILRHWDLSSGNERQVWLERRTCLVSTIVGYALAFQLVSLFLYIFTADRLHSMFVGAMCAAGSLNVNPYGYPTLVLKIITCFLAAAWLIINHADSQGYDYPLIRPKYILLLILTPLMLLETYLLYSYVSGLRADVITSCCGSLFGAGRQALSSDMAALPPSTMGIVFYGVMAATIGCGALFARSGRGGYPFSALCCLNFVVSVASLISFISLYLYESPTHHCPFCVLQPEYGHIGYLLYLTLLAGGMAGLGVGALMPFRTRASLVRVIPQLQRRLAICATFSYLLFALIASWRMLATPFRPGG